MERAGCNNDRCCLQIWNGLNNRISFTDDVSVKDALGMVGEYRKNALIDGAKHNVDHILYQVIEHDEELDVIASVSYFKGTYLSDEELIALTQKMPHAEFGVIYASYYKKLCRQALEEEKSKRIRPITLKEANAFGKLNHRHHDSVTGCKFAIGLYKTVHGENKLIGVAICGRPVSRHLDNGLTLESNRLCVSIWAMKKSLPIFLNRRRGHLLRQADSLWKMNVVAEKNGRAPGKIIRINSLQGK